MPPQIYVFPHNKAKMPIYRTEMVITNPVRHMGLFLYYPIIHSTLEPSRKTNTTNSLDLTTSFSTTAFQSPSSNSISRLSRAFSIRTNRSYSTRFALRRSMVCVISSSTPRALASPIPLRGWHIICLHCMMKTTG